MKKAAVTVKSALTKHLGRGSKAVLSLLRGFRYVFESVACVGLLFPSPLVICER